MTGSCERGNEHPGFLRIGEFLDSLRNFFIFSKRTLLRGGSCYEEIEKF